jgi:hypothetical protein
VHVECSPPSSSSPCPLLVAMTPLLLLNPVGNV